MTSQNITDMHVMHLSSAYSGFHKGAAIFSGHLYFHKGGKTTFFYYFPVAKNSFGQRGHGSMPPPEYATGHVTSI